MFFTMNKNNAVPFDNAGLAERLRRLREARRLSTRAVAMALAPGIALTHATIANYELGKTFPPVGVLAALAQLYGVALSDITSPTGRLSGVRWRNRKSKLRTSDVASFEVESIRWLTAFKTAEQLSGRSTVRKPWALPKTGDRSSLAVARRVRTELELDGQCPIPSVVDAAERLGIRLIEICGNDAIDGLAGLLDDEPIVALNAIASNDRARLSASHEIFHHLLTHCVDDLQLTNKEVEESAFECARHFLMPTAVLKDAFVGKSFVKLLRYKETYGISLSAMIYAAHREHIITDREAKWIWIEFSRKGWREREPGEVRPDRATRFEELVEELLRSQFRGRFNELAGRLGVKTNELEVRIKGAVGRQPPRATSLHTEGGHDPDKFRMRIVE